jgi:hypothetical protein
MTSRAEDLTEAQASPQAEVARVKPCTATLVLDYDSLTCYLSEGHAGPHKGRGEHHAFFWQYEVIR